MGRLLNAGFRRWFKRKVFWLVWMICFTIGITSNGLDAEETLWIFVLIGLMVSFCNGLEDEEGGFRNKVIVGYSRQKIFLSEVILSIFVSWIVLLSYLAGTVISNLCIVHLIPMMEAMKCLAMLMLIDITIVIIMVLFNYLISNKWLAMFVCMGIIIALTFIGGYADKYEEDDKLSVAGVIDSVVPMNQIEDTCGMFEEYYDDWTYTKFKLGIKWGIYERQPLTADENNKICEYLLFSIGSITALMALGFHIVSKKDFR